MDDITSNSLDMCLSEFWELVVDREAWCATVHVDTKGQIRLATELN